MNFSIIITEFSSFWEEPYEIADFFSLWLVLKITDDFPEVKPFGHSIRFSYKEL